MRRSDKAERAAAMVLVVDDEPDIRELLELTPGADGLDVKTVRQHRRGQGEL
jgi:DNA-binding response OmpR family regulator